MGSIIKKDHLQSAIKLRPSPSCLLMQSSRLLYIIDYYISLKGYLLQRHLQSPNWLQISYSLSILYERSPVANAAAFNSPHGAENVDSELLCYNCNPNRPSHKGCFLSRTVQLIQRWGSCLCAAYVSTSTSIVCQHPMR